MFPCQWKNFWNIIQFKSTLSSSLFKEPTDLINNSKIQYTFLFSLKMIDCIFKGIFERKSQFINFKGLVMQPRFAIYVLHFFALWKGVKVSRCFISLFFCRKPWDNFPPSLILCKNMCTNAVTTTSHKSLLPTINRHCNKLSKH